MIVCVCHNVSERKIQAAVDQGMSTMREMREELLVGTCCGKCHACAKQVLRDHLEKKDAAKISFFPIALAA